MFQWFRKLAWVIRNFEQVKATAEKAKTAAESADRTAAEALELIRRQTTVHMDISPHAKDSNVVICVGRYLNRDFVQVFSLTGKGFGDMVSHLHQCSRHGIIGILDAPPAFHAVVEREFSPDCRVGRKVSDRW